MLLLTVWLACLRVCAFVNCISKNHGDLFVNDNPVVLLRIGAVGLDDLVGQNLDPSKNKRRAEANSGCDPLLADDRSGILASEIALAARIGALPKLLKNDITVFLGNSNPRVSDRNHQLALRVAVGRHRYSATFRRELDRIGQEVQHNLLDLTLILIHDG